MDIRREILARFSRIDSKGMTLLTPFVVSKERKTLYFHIAKTGGSTVTKILRQAGLDDGVLTSRKNSHKTKLAHFTDIVEHWDEYFKFTITRNKYDLLVSHWHYDGHYDRDFKAFVREIVVPSEDTFSYWIDQYELTRCYGQPIFDFVGRFENFKPDVIKAMEAIGLSNYNAEQKVNRGPYDHSKHFSSYYDEETRQLVYDKFTDEIDYFGYTL